MKNSQWGKILFLGLLILLVISFSYYISIYPEILRWNMNFEIMQNYRNAIDKYIDVVYYINLDHRLDRKQEFLAEIAKIDFPEEKIVRIPGVYTKGQGSLGCSSSHIKTVEAFIESGYDTCIIFEDDFGFSEPKEKVLTSITRLFESGIEFDVCMLACWEHHAEPIPEYDFIKKVHHGLTTSGYILTKKFAHVLLENFKEGNKILSERYSENSNYHSEYKYEIDQYWRVLQKPNNWYVFEPKLGKQRDSYSDVREGEKIKEYDF